MSSSSSLSEFAGERLEADESGDREGNWSRLAADAVDVLAAVLPFGFGPGLDFVADVVEGVVLRGLEEAPVVVFLVAEVDGRGGLKGLGGISVAGIVDVR